MSIYPASFHKFSQVATQVYTSNENKFDSALQSRRDTECFEKKLIGCCRVQYVGCWGVLLASRIRDYTKSQSHHTFTLLQLDNNCKNDRPTH